jgi:hypothetical protein
MTGGTQAEYSYTQSLNIENIREVLTKESQSILLDNQEVINAVSVYKVS